MFVCILCLSVLYAIVITCVCQCDSIKKLDDYDDAFLQNGRTWQQLQCPNNACRNSITAGATKNAGVENAIRIELQGQKCRSENAGVDRTGGKCRRKLYGTPNRDYMRKSYLSY